MKTIMQFIKRQVAKLPSFFSFFLILILSSCSSLDNLLATSTPISLTQTPLPTSTIVWFPASATPTPKPDSQSAASDATPMPEIRPTLGNIILEDNFSDETTWELATSNQASSAINNQRLILSAQSGIYMTSLRRDLILTDYYAEINAQPNICQAEDRYGFLIRANASTYYRFILTCGGNVGAERYTNGNRLAIQKLEPSGDAPSGAPGSVQIGVWASGKSMHLFLNDRYQFSIIDPSFPLGTVGFFVRAEGDTPVIVSFSNLTIWKVEN
jgi:hypothetical protein